MAKIIYEMVAASEWLKMLGKRREDAGCEGGHTLLSRDEWVPPSLRKVRAFSLALFCVLFAAALQGLDSTIRLRHGLPANHSSTINAVTYLPTLGTILVGFSWYGVVSDIKKVTPWSNMNSKWASSEDCVSLDYVTGLEILSVFTASQRKHWAMFLALIGGLLSGITVALANSLVRIDLFAPSSREAKFTQDTRFNFTNSLVEATSNGYRYAFPTDYSGSRPYAAVQASRDSPSDNPIGWTSGGYAFASFTSESTTTYNSTISATVQSFAPNMNCIPWSVIKTANAHLEADFPDGIPGDVCEDGFRESGDWVEETDISGGAAGWLNVTTCNTTSGKTKEWITARIVYNPDWPFHRSKFQNQWLICDPHFNVQDAVVNVNTTTGKIISFSPLWSTARSVQLEVPVSFIFMLLRNPLEPRNQWFYSVNSSVTERELRRGIWGNQNGDPDTFFLRLADAETLPSAAPKYMNNSELFNKDVEALGNMILAQLVNSFAREQISETLIGSIETTDARLYLRRPFLHTLQAVLALIGLISGLLATALRPKTLLREDPGPMSTAATMMADSSTHVRETFARLSICSEKEMKSSLLPFQWSIVATAEGPAWLRSSPKSAALDLGKECPASPTKQNSGWNPLVLSLWARLSVSLLIIGMITALVCTLRSSQAHDGIYDNTSSAYIIFTIMPTVILLLLGYACSGIDSALRTLSVFRSLINSSKTSIYSLHVNVRDSPFFWLRRHGLRPKHSWALVASALCFFMIPGIKLVAAGLYDVKIFQTVMNVTSGIKLDASLTAHLNDNSSNPSYYSGSFAERVSTLTEWNMTDNWQLPERAGALGNLVFAEITDVKTEHYTGGLKESEVVAQVPAVEVEVNCSAIQVDLIGTYHNGQWKYRFQCSTPECQKAGVAMIYNYFSTKNLGDPDPSLDDSSQPGFNETGHWQDGFHKYYGVFGTPLKFNWLNSDNSSVSSTQPELWQIHFIDFSNTVWPLVNTTPVELNSQQQVLVTPQTFGSHIPRITSLKCPLTLNTVEVKTTFTSSHSSTGAVQWIPTSFDNAIINRTAVDPYTVAHKSAWLQPQVVTGSSTNLLRNSSTYFPTPGAATNFFELLAVYANNTLHNMSAYDSNPTAFFAAVEAVATSYTVQALLETRPWARAAAAPRRYQYYSDESYERALNTTGPNDSMRNITGTLTFTRERVVQDAMSTYVLIGLLSLMLVCLGLVFIFSPTGPLLPKSPGSIAARMSLIAGSQFVRDLREERIPRNLSRMKDDKISKAARLGWWTEDDGRTFRWGIDIGEGCLNGSWNKEPDKTELNTERLLQDGETPRRDHL